MNKQTIHDIFYVIGLVIIATLLLGAPLQILWNYLMPYLFGLPEISFWQACGIHLLLAILKPNIVTNNVK